DAALVIAGQVPLTELVRERAEIYAAAQVTEATHQTRAESKITARRRSLENWQNRWDSSQKGRWTHTLIPNITSWVERSHGQVDFYLTQVISGHGCFRSYLKRFGHETEDWCPVCGSGVVEDARHVLFEAETLVPMMLADQRVWEATATFAADVMKSFREQERRRKEQTE
ncbi:hypothetical protein KR059_003006, partial [Drosophila kikkawai]